MSAIPRWTLADLRARYELEPTLRDYFVEGNFDKDVLTRYAREHVPDKVVVYDIDSVDVPPAALIQHGFTEGNKQRVMVAAIELAPLPPACRCRFIVDRDLDHWFGALQSVPRLIWTEFTSIELYFFERCNLIALLVETAKANIPDWDRYEDSLIAILTELYVLRLADRELGWSLKWVKLERCMAWTEGRITFDAAEYVKRLLEVNKRARERKRFHESCCIWRERVSVDPRLCIRGRNLTDVLAWTVGKANGVAGFSSSDAFQRLFVLAAPTVGSLAGLLQ